MSAPANFAATVDGNSITLSWDAVSGAEGYLLYYGSASGSYDANPVDLGNVTSKNLADVPTGTYYIAIMAYAGSSRSTLSSEKRVVFLRSPANFAATMDGNTITLSWDAVSGAVEYKLFYGTNSRDYGLVPLDLGNVTSKVFTDVPDGTYYLAVVASDGTSSSSHSEEQTITIGLSAPTGFTTSASGSTVSLSWEAVSGAEGYRAYYGMSTGDYLGSLDLGNVTSKYIPDVPSGTYYVVLTSYSGSRESGYSTEKSVTVSADSKGAGGVGGRLKTEGY